MADPDAITNRKIGPYVVERELGRGAHGVVYRARNEKRPGQLFAVKVVENRGQMDRLLLEPELLSRLNHAGIVKVEDYFVDANRLVMALEYIDGEDLQTHLERHGTFDSDEVWEFISQLAASLAHAHEAGILHRDIKLRNVLVDTSQNPPRYVLTDFGISRLAGGIQAVQRKGGTYQFMAPEQLRGRPVAQSDLWSLGVACYALLTGELPFSGDTLEGLKQRILFGVPTPPSERMTAPPDEELEQTILRLLEKPLAARTESAAQLASVAQRRGRPSRPDSRSASEHPERPHSSFNTHQRRLRRRILWSRTFFWVIAAFLLVPAGPLVGGTAVAGVLLFYWGQGRQPKPTRWLVTALALVTLAAAYCLATDKGLPNIVRPPFDRLVERVPAGAAVGLWLGLVLYNLILGPCAVHLFTTARRLRRELGLRHSLQDRANDHEAYLDCLQSLLDIHPNDSYLRQRYVEAFLAQGRFADAATEARLILEDDPYDFAANLLLAQACLEAGSYAQCRAVCDKYLSVSRYCFEFAELASQCVAPSEASP